MAQKNVDKSTEEIDKDKVAALPSCYSLHTSQYLLHKITIYNKYPKTKYYP